MSQDPRIEAAIEAAADEAGDWPGTIEVQDFAGMIDASARAALDAADKAATITTVEELEALPSESLIHSEQGGVWERCDDGEVRYWITTGNSDEVFNSSKIALPTRVIHWGTE